VSRKHFRVLEGVEGSEAQRLRVFVKAGEAEGWWATVCAGGRKERALREQKRGKRERLQAERDLGRKRMSQSVGN
jgi:hypothetical protein